MIKIALSFLAGTTFSTLAIVLAGGRASAMLGLGVLLAVALGSGILRVIGVRRLARFLDAFADGLASAQPSPTRQAGSVRQSTRAPRMADRSGYVKPSSKKRDQILEDTIDEYLPDDMFAPPPVAGRVQ